MKWWQIVGGVILVLIIGGVVVNMLAPPAPAPSEVEWGAIMAQDVPSFSSEWSPTATRLGANDAGWEDSLSVSPDGGAVYFAYYPSDLISHAAKMQFVDDIDTYVSYAPFTSKEKFTQFHFSEDIWSETSAQLTSQGDFFYNSNRDYLNDAKSDTDIWLNDERLAFNDYSPDSDFGNPHYCAAKDELWFDEKDTRIWLLKDARANGFSGTPEIVASPINIPGAPSFQPFLSEDCETMYFTSNRGLAPSEGTNGPRAGIYRVQRNGDAWGEPALMASSKYIIGEPSLTADGKKLFFIQLFSDGKGNYSTDMFYVERKS